MATIPASENVFPIIRLDEVAAPSTPPAGEAHLYAKSDGYLYWKDDAGTEHEPAGRPIDVYIGPFDPRGGGTGYLNHGGANFAYTSQFQVFREETVVSTTTFIGVQSGNLCVGVYDAAGARVATTGLVACPAVGERTFAFTASALLSPGAVYYLASAADNTTVSFPTRQGLLSVPGNGYYDLGGTATLPSTITPGSIVGNVYQYLWMLNR